MSNPRASIRDALYEEPGPKAKKRIRIITLISAIALVILMARIVIRFRDSGQLDARYWSFFARKTTWRFIGEGLLGTVEVAIVSGVVAFCIGFLLMICRISGIRVLSAVSVALIEFTRGVPTLLFIYFFFLVAPQLGWKLSSFWKITLPVAISACGVVAEVLRSGVNAVPKGQREAALSLGMSRSHTFTKVIFPQAIRYVVPALIAELVIVLKDTTFAYIVSFPDLMQNAKVLISNYDAMLAVYMVVAVIYILINYVLNKISAGLARRGTSWTGRRYRKPSAAV